MKFTYRPIMVPDDTRNGAQIRRSRKRLGVRLVWLAEQLRISSPFLSELERGSRRWSEELFTEATRILGRLQKQKQQPKNKGQKV